MTPHQSPERCRRRRHPRLSSSPAAATSTGAPAEGAANLPTELIFEILSRVPVRFVFRFRCVSKGWRSLLRDPIFLAAHKSLSAETFIVVSAFSSQEARPGAGRDPELRLMDMDGNDVKVIHGLPCYRLHSTGMDDLVCVRDDMNNGPCVINMATGEVLVDCPKHEERSWESYNYVFGFGRAIPSGTYKVLRFLAERGCEVFSLGDGFGWRRAKYPPVVISNDRSSVVAVKGVMYFLVMRNVSADTLLCFDIESEEWTKAIESPQEVTGYRGSSWLVTIAELNDTVCMVQSKVWVNYEYINIWLLEDSHKGIWIKAYTIPVAKSVYHYTPLSETRDGGKLILYCFVSGRGGALKVYDRHTDTCTTLRRLHNVTGNISLCSLL